MKYRIRSAEVARYPVIRITFDDGLSGEYDLSHFISKEPPFTPFKDEAYFRTVAVAEYGRSFGWNLDELGQEIDFCTDATRISIETAMVKSSPPATGSACFRLPSNF